MSFSSGPARGVRTLPHPRLPNGQCSLRLSLALYQVPQTLDLGEIHSAVIECETREFSRASWAETIYATQSRYDALHYRRRAVQVEFEHVLRCQRGDSWQVALVLGQLVCILIRGHARRAHPGRRGPSLHRSCPGFSGRISPAASLSELGEAKSASSSSVRASCPAWAAPCCPRPAERQVPRRGQSQWPTFRAELPGRRWSMYCHGT